MNWRIARRAVAASFLGLLVVSCASDGDGGSAAETDGAPPATDASPTTTERTSEVPTPTSIDSVPRTTSGDTSTSDEAEAAGTTTTTAPLAASPEADLPTAAPGDATEAPATTIAGPLPEPSVELLEINTYSQPLEIAAVEGDGRLFVVEQGGRVIASDAESDAVVFDIASVDTTFQAGGEQGLLGLAFHPTEDLAYIDFTDGDGTTVVAEMAVDPISYEFDADSYREVLTVRQPFANHNGGELAFGPDGHLYIGLGDGGSGGDPNRVALDRSSRLGKILRIDPLAAPDAPFSVPDDNPFVGTDGADPTIWSQGLRNPWRFSFDALTGDLWIADVGQDMFEEINLARASDGRDAGKGLSFGWSAFEANAPFNEDVAPAGHTPPVASYPHDGGKCSVSGGAVARTSTFEDLNGWYVYGDLCSGQIWGLDTTSVGARGGGSPRIVELATVPRLSAIAEGPFGELYATSINGPVFRLIPAS